MKKALERLQTLRKAHVEKNKIYRPEFYRLGNEEDLKKFNEILSLAGLTVVDQIADQIGELLKLLRPNTKYSTEALNSEINLHLGSTNIDCYGVWVFYPWSRRLVHILDEEEFILVRTSRNQYKITPEEKEILASKKIGIIGLSVGQSVAVTLAMERICTELRLADFDVLELTNLNRIRTGIHNLGLPKVYSVAREIAEIDPFIKTICFTEGLTEENMDLFFSGGGRLDLLVEESDGFEIKILSRYKARELKIPVIMEGSDRCVLDIERFDLEPKRDILHGLVNHLDVKILKELKTTEQKIPYMLDMVGINTASERLKASMLEIEQSITTWPQLASAVTMGGGITADVSRRILLKQFNESGRYHIDIEELVGDKTETDKELNNLSEVVISSLPALAEKAASIKNSSLRLEKHVLEKIVKAGCQAPSAGNLQPWKWIYRNDQLFLFNAFEKDTRLAGYKELATLVALGAATENIVLSSADKKLKATAHFYSEHSSGPVVSFSFSALSETPVEDLKLASVIDMRLTNRLLGPRAPIDQAILNDLGKLVTNTDKNFDLLVFTDEDKLRSLGDMLGDLDKIRLMDPKTHEDFVNEIRWTELENELQKDGIDLRTIDLTNSERVGLVMAREKKVISLLDKWNAGNAFKKLSQKAIDSAGALGIVVMKGNDPENYFKGGRMMQRLWLEANRRRLALQPLAAPVFLFAPVLDGSAAGMSPSTVKKLKDLRPAFEKLFTVPVGYTEVFIFRLASNLDEPKIKSLRKPLEEMFSYYN